MWWMTECKLGNVVLRYPKNTKCQRLFVYRHSLVGGSENLAPAHPSLIETTVARQLRMWIWRHFLQQEQFRMNLSLMTDSCISQTKTEMESYSHWTLSSKIWPLFAKGTLWAIMYINEYSLKFTSRYTHWSYRGCFSVDDVLSATGCAVYRKETKDAYRNPVKYYIKAMSSYKGMYFIPVNVKRRH